MIAAFLISTALACATDKECKPTESCQTVSVRCAQHPESSTCEARECRAKPIDEAERKCKQDSDCAVVTTQCPCLSCARENDREMGVIVAVTATRAKKFEGHCSEQQTKSCAMSAPCARTGEWIATCANHICVANFKSAAP